MARSVYLNSPEGLSGKSLVALGLISLLVKRGDRVGVFRPFVPDLQAEDPMLTTLATHLGEKASFAVHVGVSCQQMQDNPAEALVAVTEIYRDLAARYDVVVVIGSDYTSAGAALEFSLNSQTAANLGTPVLLNVPARGRTPREILHAVRSAAQATRAEYATLCGVVINRVDPDLRPQFLTAANQLRSELAVPCWVLAEIPLLSAPTVGELCRAVDGDLTLGDPELLKRECAGLLICGMGIDSMLERLQDGQVVVAAADREQLLITLQAAHASQAFPSLAGIILNGTREPTETVWQLVRGMNLSLPVIRTPLDTFDVAYRLSTPDETVRIDNQRKLTTALAEFAQQIDGAELTEVLENGQPQAVTPIMFEVELLDKARRSPQRIVLPEPDDDRILQAAAILLARKVADIILLGNEAEVRARAEELGLDISAARVVSPLDESYLARYAPEFARLRAKKGITEAQARQILTDVSYFGTMMVHMGDADGMVSGAAHTTAHTIVPSFQIIKTKPGTSIVSSVFLMLLDDEVLVYGDCAVNPDPTAEQLADIAISSAETAAQFGIEPRVAMLSYSTGESGSGADVDKVRAATKIAQERRPDLLLEGPIQYDAAVDATVAAKKLPGSAVAGRATVLIFPDLNAGNNTYKAVQRSSGATAVGPVLQGLRKPVNDLSRGALVHDIVNTVAITAVQAQTVRPS